MTRVCKASKHSPLKFQISKTKFYCLEFLSSWSSTTITSLYECRCREYNSNQTKWRDTLRVGTYKIQNVPAGCYSRLRAQTVHVATLRGPKWLERNFSRQIAVDIYWRPLWDLILPSAPVRLLTFLNVKPIWTNSKKIPTFTTITVSWNWFMDIKAYAIVKRLE